jgi:hypothetical protein
MTYLVSRKCQTWAAVVLIILALGIGTAGAVVRSDGPSRRTTEVLHRPVPSVPSESTMLEAWDITQKAFEPWGPGWAVASMTSSDVNDVPTKLTGVDGRRRTWQAEAIGPKGELRWLRITSGTAVDVIEPGPTAAANGLRPVPRPAIDSDRAVTLALADREDLEGSEEKAIGLHIWFGADLLTGRDLLTVSGAVNGQRARLTIDPASETVLKRERLNLTGGGLLVSRDAGASWTHSSLSGVVRAVGSDKASGRDSPSVYAAAWSGDSLGLWRSTDDGRSWMRLAVLPPTAGEIAYDLAVAAVADALRVYVATPGGLWQYDIHTAKLAAEDTPGLVFALGSDENGQLHALIMTPKQPDTARHFVRSTLGPQSWSLVSDERTDRLTRGARIEAFATDSVSTRDVLDVAISASGTTQIKATSVGLEQSRNAGTSWRRVMDGHPARVALSPGFDADGVAIVTAFPDIVFRSSDFGDTWRAVKVLSQSRNAGLPFFLSPSLVFISLEGGLTWQEF